MDKIPVNNSNSEPPTTTAPPGNLFSFIGEALRVRLYDTFLKPPTFIYSPPRQPSSNDQGRSSSRRQDRGDLNYPFVPISPSNPSTESNSDDINILEGKISELEDSMKNILSSENVPPPPQPPSPEQVTRGEDSRTVSEVPYKDLDTLLLPPFPQMKDKMPPNVYQELLAIYESQILMTGGGVPDITSDKENISSTTTQTRGEDYDDPQRCRDREKNVRSEVLKWNKD